MKRCSLNFPTVINDIDEYENLDLYNGDTVHDMWVDYDHHQNTGEPDVFDEEDIDDIVDELNYLN